MENDKYLELKRELNDLLLIKDKPDFEYESFDIRYRTTMEINKLTKIVNNHRQKLIRERIAEDRVNNPQRNYIVNPESELSSLKRKLKTYKKDYEMMDDPVVGHPDFMKNISKMDAMRIKIDTTNRKIMNIEKGDRILG